MEATERLPAEKSSPATARRFCRERLGEWGVAGEVIESMQLVVSELVTNAVCHAQTPALITLRLDGANVRVEVSDESDRSPARDRARGDAPGGWGIPIVEALSERWGVEPTNDHTGKTVWAELGARSTAFGFAGACA